MISRMKAAAIEPAWRVIEKPDISTIGEIGNATHLNLPERPQVFAEKVQIFSKGCRVLVYSGEVVGYGISHPWHLFSVPPLDTFLKALPSEPSCIFINDVVVLPEARGRGAALQFIDIIAAVARERNIPSLALVSVYDTCPLWAKRGFKVVHRPNLAQKLRSYGDTAKYMVHDLN